MGYFTVNPHEGDGFHDLKYLNDHEAYYESDFLRHIRFDESLVVKIDGRKNKGVLFKEGIN